MKIAILLSDSAGYDMSWRAAQLASRLSALPSPAGQKVEVAIGLPRTEDALWRRKEADIWRIAPESIVRYLLWESVETAMALRMYPDVQADLQGIEQVRVPRDYGWNFIDCDAWIVMADPALGAILPVRPIAYYLRDLAVRYAPAAFAETIHSPYWQQQTNAFRLWRQSRAVFASAAATLDDASSYAGVRRDRLLTVPFAQADGLDGERFASNACPTVLWLAEPDARHDPACALEGMRLFLAEGQQARLVIAGTRRFDASVPALTGLSPSAMKIFEAAEHEVLQNEADLRRLLRRVDLIWSSAIADGESEGLLRAAAAGLPFLGYNYPQNAELAGRLGAAVFLYPERSPAAVADALHRAWRTVGEGQMVTSRDADPLAEAWLPVLDRLSDGTA